MKGRTYRYFTGEPLYPFGYGLSYTTFRYSNLTFDKPSLEASDNLIASVDVKNTGKTAGDGVVGVDLTNTGGDGAAGRALAGFHSVDVEAGATGQVPNTVPHPRLSGGGSGGTRKIVPR